MLYSLVKSRDSCSEFCAICAISGSCRDVHSLTLTPMRYALNLWLMEGAVKKVATLASRGQDLRAPAPPKALRHRLHRPTRMVVLTWLTQVVYPSNRRFLSSQSNEKLNCAAAAEGLLKRPAAGEAFLKLLKRYGCCTRGFVAALFFDFFISELHLA